VLIETSTRPTTIEGRRWLYTAITRAKESCYFAMEV
jgi:superfamily I DNA/RNA helicase